MGSQKAAFLSDNQCFAPGMAWEGIYCVTEKSNLKGEKRSNEDWVQACS